MLTTLDTIFETTVREGWRPRTPAFGVELAQLDVSVARGTCLNPIIFEGDELFLDPETPPRSGDLVAFRLSERGAERQNSDLPAGQEPWQPGAHWLKLYWEYHSIPMLLENTHSASVSLMAGDSPLVPVRNVRRAGRLLFRDCYMSGLGLNAATITNVGHFTPTGVSLTGATGVTLLNPTLNMTNSPNYDCTAIATVNITARQTTGTVGDVSLLIVFADDNVTHVNSTSIYKVLSSSDQQYTLQWEFSHLGANVGLGKAWVAADPGSTSDTLVYGPATIQVEYVIR